MQKKQILVLAFTIAFFLLISGNKKISKLTLLIILAIIIIKGTPEKTVQNKT